jgi:LysR family transcriptional regulator of gallate degradation
MDLRRLEYFLSVARHLSITAAAADLGLAQPTLTKSIRMLEQELGVQLFQRLPRGVELTEFGRSLLRHAEAMHVQVQDALNEIEGLRGGAIGVVTIGAGPSWLRRHLPLAVARTLSRNPDLKVRIDGGYDDVLLRTLRHGEVDFVVAELPSPDRAKDLEVTPLTSDSLGVCCREKHPLVAERNIPLSVLLDFPWIMPSRRTRAQRRLQALFIAANLAPPELVVETESMAFILQMLRDSDALTFTTSTTLRSREGEGLTILDVPLLHTTREAGIVTRKGGWLSPAATLIVSELKTICATDPHN